VRLDSLAKTRIKLSKISTQYLTTYAFNQLKKYKTILNKKGKQQEVCNRKNLSKTKVFSHLDQNFCKISF
jgi:hypothetical protein